MKRKLILFFLGLGLLLLLPACAVAPMEEAPAEEEPAAEEPAQEETVPTAPMPTQADVPPTALPTQDLLIPTQAATAIPSIPESRHLILEFPPKIRAGDSDIIRLTLEVDETGNIIPTAEIEGHEVTGEVIEVENLYETHNIIAEARLDLAGLEVLPAELVSEPLLPGKSVTFYWSVSAADEGSYTGTVWFYLRYIAKEGDENRRRTISAQTIHIRSTKYFGILSASPAKKLGAFGSFLGAVLGFPFVDDVFKFLWKRFKR